MTIGIVDTKKFEVKNATNLIHVTPTINLFEEEKKYDLYKRENLHVRQCIPFDALVSQR